MVDALSFLNPYANSYGYGYSTPTTGYSPISYGPTSYPGYNNYASYPYSNTYASQPVADGYYNNAPNQASPSYSPEPSASSPAAAEPSASDILSQLSAQADTTPAKRSAPKRSFIGYFVEAVKAGLMALGALAAVHLSGMVKPFLNKGGETASGLSKFTSRKYIRADGGTVYEIPSNKYDEHLNPLKPNQYRSKGKNDL